MLFFSSHYDLQTNFGLAYASVIGNGLYQVVVYL